MKMATMASEAIFIKISGYGESDFSRYFLSDSYNSHQFLEKVVLVFALKIPLLKLIHGSR